MAHAVQFQYETINTNEKAKCKQICQPEKSVHADFISEIEWSRNQKPVRATVAATQRI